MRRFLLFFIFAAYSTLSFSQRLSLNFFGGVANYEGDLQNKFFTFSQPKLTIGGGLSYQLSDRLSVRTGITFGAVTSDDKKNPNLAVRNLNFSTSITELHLAAEYDLFNLDEASFTPYFFAGIAVYHFNPYTFDTTGTKYFLQPLSTEGQGFYLNRKPYNLTQFAIPFGGGIKFPLNNSISIGLELGLRKLFTDYLDDVSTTYADPDMLLANRGPKAVELAYRGAELPNGATYPTANSKRGEPKNKDWYYFTGITLSLKLPGAGERIDRSSGAKNKRSKVGCPTRVY